MLDTETREGKNMKNLDFRVRPDGRDIFIEVTTPRMRLETGLMYSDTPHAGFFDPGRGIEREGYAGPSRAEIVVENKVINQILEATSGIPTTRWSSSLTAHMRIPK